MGTSDNNQRGFKRANDRLHGSDLGETKDFNNLSYDKEKNSFEYDVKSDDPDYDHPLPYDTTAANGADENSAYDEANPYVGDEYASRETQIQEGLEDLGMRVDDKRVIEVKPEDEFLARTPEDDRPDLDEEGYPLNDTPPRR
ncbi:hypothetical protein [Pedobacter nutrimenti]|jgi:hypothetical protein|uniref:Uncharacterized protein n=1 Tax=Pedobacter nutrimenti TaxID=1241337 RepID=A0A318UH55_9SPHI|nr:hypothetical protein [Pedobacter nutrimenti]PYF72434.1 hypothetical protein B0O44_10683 [Pedobacter nutrimenti]